MLDNFDGPGVQLAAKAIRDAYPTGFLIEGSGGLTKGNCGAYMGEFVDVLSFGSITQGMGHVDFSLKIDHSY